MAKHQDAPAPDENDVLSDGQDDFLPLKESQDQDSSSEDEAVMMRQMGLEGAEDAADEEDEEEEEDSTEGGSEQSQSEADTDGEGSGGCKAMNSYLMQFKFLDDLFVCPCFYCRLSVSPSWCSFCWYLWVASGVHLSGSFPFLFESFELACTRGCPLAPPSVP